MEKTLLENTTRFQRDPNLFATEIDDELVIMDEKQDCYFSFNSVGKSIWDALDTPKSPREIVTALTTRYEVDEAQCELDVEKFLLELIKNKLVVRTYTDRQ